MKTLFSIILGLVIASSGIALAVNAKTQESICSEVGHDGYNTSLTGNPTPTFNPLVDPLPSGWNHEGTYGPLNDFICDDTNPTDCHWAYKPAEGTTPAAWVLCKGDIERL